MDSKLMGKRILALDYGTKRIGVALSDELGWTAQPLETYRRRTLEADLAHIAALVREHEAGEVVLGLPIRTTGELGPEAAAVEDFRRRLQPLLSVPIVTWDERHTTQSAEELLIEADLSRAKRREVVDRVAAAILLQSYLAGQTSRASRTDSSTTPDAPSVEDWPIDDNGSWNGGAPSG
ncbi:MAG TPA: Holliday junction resolvase RuvX [Nitrospiraceae bacterium]|nr:Holliday junction resolvase RuvX [Nitrospiraceae bacterium]